MNEAAAAQVLLLRAYESTGFAPWSDADRAWAGRAALQTVGADAAADEFLAAHLGLEGAADAAIGTCCDDRVLRLADLDYGFLRQRRGRAGLHASPARDALR